MSAPTHTAGRLPTLSDVFENNKDTSNKFRLRGVLTLQTYNHYTGEDSFFPKRPPCNIKKEMMRYSPKEDVLPWGYFKCIFSSEMWESNGFKKQKDK